MGEGAAHEAVTMSRHAVHNPNEPRHFMRLRPADRRIRVTREGEVLCETTKALWLLEVGKDFYAPVLYVPRSDVVARLTRAEKSTHCPLKGDASYLDLAAGDRASAVAEIAWSYETPFDFAADLKDLIAFDLRHVTIESAPP